MTSLVEIDALEALVIIDNELDIMSPPALNTVQATGNMGHLALGSRFHVHDRAEASKEMRMESICCSAHGLSVLLTAIKGDQRRTMLFDVGPEGDIWERNVKRLGPVLSAVERIQLSHWHRDHSGGMLKAIEMIKEAREGASKSDPVIVDLHPSRPDYRGFRALGQTLSLEADPTFEEIEGAGARVEKNSETHTVLDDMFLVSGEIPRRTEYETGLKTAVRFDKSTGAWEEDELIMDERFLACNVKGKGIVLFTGCSHAGVVNASKHAMDVIGKETPLYAIFGGYHLATSEEPQMVATIRDLKALDPKVLLPGHCTGWRAKFEIEREMPDRLVPASVGIKYAF